MSGACQKQCGPAAFTLNFQAEILNVAASSSVSKTQTHKKTEEYKRHKSLLLKARWFNLAYATNYLKPSVRQGKYAKCTYHKHVSSTTRKQSEQPPCSLVCGEHRYSLTKRFSSSNVKLVPLISSMMGTEK